MTEARPPADPAPAADPATAADPAPAADPATAADLAPATAAAPVARTGPPPGFVATVELRNASRWYGNVVAINDISISLGAGITGLLGPNGAGKSTLLHLVAGLLRPSAGAVEILGRPAWHDPEIYRRIGLVPEKEAVHAFLTGYEFVLLNARLQSVRNAPAAARQAIATVQLEDAADRAIGTYSKGMRQRIKVAAALAHEPPVLLLDEPFNGMDPRQRLHMMELLTRLAAEGRTVLFSSHILEEVERLAQSVLVIFAGRLAASGDFREIRRLMTDRPHTFTIRSSDDRRLAAALVADASVFGVELVDGTLTVRSSEFAAFTRQVAGIARASGVRLFELRPTDESLESVFAYLVRR